MRIAGSNLPLAQPHSATPPKGGDFFCLQKSSLDYWQDYYQDYYQNYWRIIIIIGVKNLIILFDYIVGYVTIS